MPHNSEIKGKVIDSYGNPIGSAVVLIKKGPIPHQDIAILTNDEGFFNLLDLAYGNYILMVNKEGYKSKSIETKASGSSKVQVVVKMEEE